MKKKELKKIYDEFIMAQIFDKFEGKQKLFALYLLNGTILLINYHFWKCWDKYRQYENYKEIEEYLVDRKVFTRETDIIRI